jgi:hypothetical protein
VSVGGACSLQENTSFGEGNLAEVDRERSEAWLIELGFRAIRVGDCAFRVVGNGFGKICSKGCDRGGKSGLEELRLELCA